MRRRRRGAADGEDAEDFPLAPMIDLVFLLLVFFMTVSSVAETERAVAVTLPEAERARPRPSEGPPRWTVTVTADGALHLGAVPVAVSALGEQLRPGLQARPDAVVVVRADAATRFGETRRALAAAAGAGAAEVRFGALVAPPGAGVGQ